MTLKGPEFKKALLLGLVVATIPLFYYPQSFGWSNATRGGIQVFVVEVLYYLVIFHFAFPREPFAHRFKAAATAFAYRLFLGLVWAVLAAGFFDLSVGKALAVGIYGYIPGALLHAALVPFLLRPVFRFRDLRRPRPASQPSSFESTRARKPMLATEAQTWTGSDQTPDFTAAVSHVASYSTVELAMLVDEEGLTVARACRGQVDTDLWAPVINLLYDSVLRELSRTPDAQVSRFQITLTRQRLVVERVAPFYLAVLFDHNTDELVNVRIAQAVEMIRRYYEQKYPQVAQSPITEVAYV